MQLEMKILGGLPVTVEFSVQSAEPEVGLFSSYVDGWEIKEVNQKRIKNCDWLYKRIDAKKGEDERILDAINEYLSNFVPGEPYDDAY